MRRSFMCVLAFFVLLTALNCFSQQDWVSRYDAFSGYSFLTVPKLNLFENGYNAEFGVNIKPWVALGGDFSVFTGSTTLTQNQLSHSLLTELEPILGQLPPGYKIQSPYDATTYTYSAGPQFNIRKLKWITFFVRPGLGAFHQSVNLKPNDPITKGIIETVLNGRLKTSDTVVFYGFGGGMDFNTSKHVAIRVTADFVHFNVFSSLLNGGENSVRFSIGPTFRWGQNIVKK